MDLVIKCLRNDDVYSFEKSRHLLNNLDSSLISNYPNIFFGNPSHVAYAAFYGAIDCFLFLLKQGIKIHNIDDECRSAIHFACAGGSYKMVYMLIKDFDQFSCIDALGRTALHYSAEYDQFEISKLLVEIYSSNQTKSEESTSHGSVLINKKDIFGITALHFSVENENIELVDYFIKSGANINLRDNDGCASIHIAAKIGSISLITKLLKNGAKLNARSKYGRTILHFAAFSNTPFIFKDLISFCQVHIDLNVNTPDQFGRIPLHYACEQGLFSVVHELLRMHSNVTQRDVDMMMPIHFAALNGNADVIQLLIKYGSPVYVKDENLRTPLHLACESGSYKAVCFLCNKYKNLIKEETRNGSTPLHSVTENNNQDNGKLVRFLVSKGIDINKKNKFGQTPLHCATQNGLFNAISELIESGANTNIEDDSLCNPLDIAFSLNNEEAKEILIENGACLSPNRSSPSSRLSSTTQSPCSSPKIVRKLIKTSVEHKDFKLENFI